jgi:hypothetical protein
MMVVRVIAMAFYQLIALSRFEVFSHHFLDQLIECCFGLPA